MAASTGVPKGEDAMVFMIKVSGERLQIGGAPAIAVPEQGSIWKS